MIAGLLLPSYGGSATVWSTSSLFFQVVLLLGYLYTDRATRVGPRRQRVLHGLFLLTPLVVLPLALPSNAAPGTDVSPVMAKFPSIMTNILAIALRGRWYRRGDGLPERKQ